MKVSFGCFLCYITNSQLLELDLGPGCQQLGQQKYISLDLDVFDMELVALVPKIAGWDLV